jgi:hypothetical protein
MHIRTAVAGSVLAAGLGVAGIVGAGAASAEGAGSDNTSANGGTATGSNPSISDTQGFGVVNHMQGDGTRVGTDGLPGGDYNGDLNGIGGIRSTQSGAAISSTAGTNRVAATCPACTSFQVQDTNSTFSPGQTKK